MNCHYLFFFLLSLSLGHMKQKNGGRRCDGGPFRHLFRSYQRLFWPESGCIGRFSACFHQNQCESARFGVNRRESLKKKKRQHGHAISDVVHHKPCWCVSSAGAGVGAAALEPHLCFLEGHTIKQHLALLQSSFQLQIHRNCCNYS